MSGIDAKRKSGICLPSQLKTRLSSVFVAEIVAIVVGVGSGGVFELT